MKAASNEINAALATRPTNAMITALEADLGPGEQHPIKKLIY